MKELTIAKSVLLLGLFFGLSRASEENNTLTDLPTGNPVIETKVEGLGKIYFGNKLYLRCPLSEEEVKENLKLTDEREEEQEPEEDDEGQSQPLNGLKWFHDGAPLEASKNESKEVLMRKEWLYMENENIDHLMGTFNCEYKDEEVASFRSVLALSIVKFQTSYTVTEGEDLKLHCQVANPKPSAFTLTWFYKKNLEDPLIPIQEVMNASDVSEEAHLKILSKDGVPNAVLKIEDAVYEDRAYYYCFGENENEVVRVGTLVRVKDKYAALWPFLGIVAEVLVLCFIILLCDKRAAKKEEEEEELPSGGASNIGGDSSGLRQRK